MSRMSPGRVQVSSAGGVGTQDLQSSAGCAWVHFHALLHAHMNLPSTVYQEANSPGQDAQLAGHVGLCLNISLNFFQVLVGAPGVGVCGRAPRSTMLAGSRRKGRVGTSAVSPPLSPSVGLPLQPAGPPTKQVLEADLGFSALTVMWASR